MKYLLQDHVLGKLQTFPSHSLLRMTLLSFLANEEAGLREMKAPD